MSLSVLKVRVEVEYKLFDINMIYRNVHVCELHLQIEKGRHFRKKNGE